MDVQVSGHQMDVGEALRSRIVSELSDNVEKYFDRGGSAEVRINPDGHGYRVDVSLYLASGQFLVSHGVGGDAHAAFDDAQTKIEKRVRRYKRRLKNHNNPAGKASNPGDIGVETTRYIVLQGQGGAADDEPEDDDGATGGDEPLVVAETETPLRTMTVAMAVLELDLSGRPVLLFRNAAHGGLAVVYQRPDGNIGWIDPQRIQSAGAAA
ncbi:MAG TPA: ribosome-associated translation inhibitor RaiA [Caulobacteraceae bacterium]